MISPSRHPVLLLALALLGTGFLAPAPAAHAEDEEAQPVRRVPPMMRRLRAQTGRAVPVQGLGGIPSPRGIAMPTPARVTEVRTPTGLIRHARGLPQAPVPGAVNVDRPLFGPAAPAPTPTTTPNPAVRGEALQRLRASGRLGVRSPEGGNASAAEALERFAAHRDRDRPHTTNPPGTVRRTPMRGRFGGATGGTSTWLHPSFAAIRRHRGHVIPVPGSGRIAVPALVINGGYPAGDFGYFDPYVNPYATLPGGTEIHEIDGADGPRLLEPLVGSEQNGDGVVLAVADPLEDPLFIESTHAFEAGDFQDARRGFARLLHHYRSFGVESGELWMAWVQVNFALGSYADAAKGLRVIAALGGLPKGYQFDVGSIFPTGPTYEKALERLERRVAENRRDVYAREVLAYHQVATGQHASAFALLQQVRALDARSPIPEMLERAMESPDLK